MLKELLKQLEDAEIKEFINGYFKEEIKAKQEARKNEIKSQFDNLLFWML